MKKSTKTNTLASAFTQLKTLDVPTTSAAPAPKSTSDIVVVPVTGTALAEYVEHDAAEKSAAAGKKQLRGGIERVGIDKIYEHNVQTPEIPATTAKLIDEAGNAVNVSFTKAYKEVDRPAALSALASLGVTDPNPYLQENVAISFDTSIFLDAKGELRQDLYIAMMEAIEGIALDHKVASPFSSRKVTTVRPDFHTKRWSIKGKTVLDPVQIQAALSKTFVNTVSLTPQAPVKPVPKAE